MRKMGRFLAVCAAVAASAVVARADGSLTGNTTLDGLVTTLSSVQTALLGVLVTVVLVGIVVHYVRTWGKGRAR